MRFEKIIPMLYIRDLEGTVDFYRRVLGFSILAFRPDWGWARMQRDGVELMFSLPNDHLPFDRSRFTGSFYFYTREIEKWWMHLKDHVSVAYPLDDFDHGMREFAIYDNNGYMLQFGEEIEG